jgi:spermidine synthase
VNFDRVARSYRLLESVVFGGALQRARVRWLDELETPQRALVIGEGDGRFLSELVRHYPKLQIDCVEASAGMIELIKRRLRLARIQTPSVNFIQEDFRHWTPTGSYDVLVTHFFLDCFDEKELEEIVPKIKAVLSPRGVWLLADFTIPRSGCRRVCAQLLISVMYAFFRAFAGLQTKRLIDPAAWLIASGLTCAGSELSLGKMVKSELWRKESTGI